MKTVNNAFSLIIRQKEELANKFGPILKTRTLVSGDQDEILEVNFEFSGPSKFSTSIAIDVEDIHHEEFGDDDYQKFEESVIKKFKSVNDKASVIYEFTPCDNH